jgi:ATP-dependent RNA helicase DDX10/DBP4
MRGEVGGPSATAMLGVDGEEDDGYVSPEFDLPSEDEDERRRVVPPAKRRKGSGKERVSDKTGGWIVGLEDEEALALALLRRDY